MPATTATAPSSCAAAAVSPNASQPVAAPTSGSRLRKAPAVSAGTCAWPWANSQNGSSVPASDSATSATTGPATDGAGGAPSQTAATGSATSAPAANWTAVTAAGSRPASRRGWATMKVADSATEPSTSRSPGSVAPDPPAPATAATPPSATA